MERGIKQIFHGTFSSNLTCTLYYNSLKNNDFVKGLFQPNKIIFAFFKEANIEKRGLKTLKT